MTATLADSRIIAKYCIDSLATAVILIHNHPSGKNEPSRADREVTDKIKRTLNIFDCKVLDHIILTETDFYSFADNNLI